MEGRIKAVKQAKLAERENKMALVQLHVDRVLAYIKHSKSDHIVMYSELVVPEAIELLKAEFTVEMLEDGQKVKFSW